MYNVPFPGSNLGAWPFDHLMAAVPNDANYVQWLLTRHWLPKLMACHLLVEVSCKVKNVVGDTGYAIYLRRNISCQVVDMCNAGCSCMMNVGIVERSNTDSTFEWIIPHSQIWRATVKWTRQTSHLFAFRLAFFVRLACSRAVRCYSSEPFMITWVLHWRGKSCTSKWWYY